MQDPSSFLHKNFAVAMNRAPDEKCSIEQLKQSLRRLRYSVNRLSTFLDLNFDYLTGEN